MTFKHRLIIAFSIVLVLPVLLFILSFIVIGNVVARGEEGDDAARKTDCYLPLTVAGPLIPGKAEVSGKGGSQLLSGLLAALPLCEGKSAMYVEQPRSIPYLFITVDVLKKFGITMSSEVEGGEDFIGILQAASISR